MGKVNIIGERAWNVFVDRDSVELENLLKTHLGLVGKGTHNTVSFDLEHLDKLNTVLQSQGLLQVQIVKEACTIEEYNSLALKNAGQPQKVGHTWLYSYKDWKYDTPSNDLEDDCYAVEPGGRVIGKPIGKDRVSCASIGEVIAKLGEIN